MIIKTAKYITRWVWVLHANALSRYPGAEKIDLLLYRLAH